MNLLDIVSIVFICTAANHLGLIPAIELVVRRRLPLANCIKCLTFWAVFGYGCYGLAAGRADIFQVLAISFLSAWASIWLDLCMGIIDHLYLKVYDKIYTTADGADADALGADNSLSGVSDE